MGNDKSQAFQSTASGTANTSAFTDFLVRNRILRKHLVEEILAKVHDGESVGHLLVSLGLISSRDCEAIEQLISRNGSGIDSFELADVKSTVAMCPQVSTENASGRQHSVTQEEQLFGDYEVLGELGRGGMGVVFKARHRTLRRIVALKMIRSGEFADNGQVRRFYAEAEAAAKLDHPGIVPVYESGEFSGRHFFSMAFVEGHALTEETKDGPMDPRRAASVLKRVAEALHFAHENGIVHRDIKPANILLDLNGQPRIADFGLAKHVTGENDMTREGHILGTPSYMAPEQASGQSHCAGAGADIYAAGATLYYLLTGRPPIQAASKMETIRQVIETEPAPPRRLNPAISRDLETICLKCLRKDPKSRYPTAAELARDLGNWLESKPISARRASLLEKAWLWCKRRPTVAGSMAMLTLATIFGMALITVQNRINADQIAQAELNAKQESAESRVEAVLSAPAAGLPFAIETLSDYQEYAIPLLKERLESDSLSDRQRLNIALVLARFDEMQDDFLISQIRNCSTEQSSNLVKALRRSDSATDAINAVAERLKSVDSNDTNYLARLAITALYLGDETLAVEMTKSDENPTKRSVFIDVLRTWRDGLNGMPSLISRLGEHPSLQYALILGLSDSSDLENEVVQEEWEIVLKDLYVTGSDTGVHSACALALRKLKVELPATVAGGASKTVARYTNRSGMRMVRIPAGSFTRQSQQGSSPQVIKISRPFYLADRETTVGQFVEFVGNEFDESSANLPAGSVSWSQALDFCNWLSEKEGLTPCYQGEKETRQWIAEANGYRLPTEAEWEYACRAGSTTEYFFGNDDTLLSFYAVSRQSKAEPVASKFPNRWGLFDTSGNIREWCFDQWQADYPKGDHLSDPIGPTDSAHSKYGEYRVLRGGHFDFTSGQQKSMSRGYGIPRNHTESIGFRVAKTVSP